MKEPKCFGKENYYEKNDKDCLCCSHYSKCTKQLGYKEKIIPKIYVSEKNFINFLIVIFILAFIYNICK